MSNARLSAETWQIERVMTGDAAKLDRVAPEVFTTPIDPAYLAAYLVEPLMLLVVARAGDLVIGQAKCAVHRHPEKAADGYVDDLRVTPDFQRRGVARALLHELECWAREKGCADLWLAAEPGDAGANALYASFAASVPCALYYWDL